MIKVQSQYNLILRHPMCCCQRAMSSFRRLSSCGTTTFLLGHGAGKDRLRLLQGLNLLETRLLADVEVLQDEVALFVEVCLLGGELLELGVRVRQRSAGLLLLGIRLGPGLGLRSD